MGDVFQSLSEAAQAWVTFFQSLSEAILPVGKVIKNLENESFDTAIPSVYFAIACITLHTILYMYCRVAAFIQKNRVVPLLFGG